jgi:hypothetical protein
MSCARQRAGIASMRCALRLSKAVAPGEFVAVRERSRRYGTTTKDALTALWEASDRVKASVPLR